jgi:NAD(P)-dependent dehydrogenase (short-subunit alcohol dehydrogenase family)
MVDANTAYTLDHLDIFQELDRFNLMMFEQPFPAAALQELAELQRQVKTPLCADESAESFDRVTAINLRGICTCMKHELLQMRTQGSGAIVNCSSLGGLVGQAGRAAYHATKHGVIGLTKSAAMDYAPRGIRINAVCPGVIDTPLGGAMESDAIKDIMRDQPIARLGSPGASFVLGVALPVDGGFTAH